MNLFIKILFISLLISASGLFAQKNDSLLVKTGNAAKNKPFYLSGGVNDIYLNSTPQDAYVYKGDSLLGHTPLFLKSGTGVVLLEKPGYKGIEFNLSLQRNSATVNLNFEYPAIKEKFYQKPIFKIIVGSVVALGAASAYLKLKADRHYENYLNSGSNNELKSTRKYDLLSGLSFGALQINLGILLYHFLKD
ncbi:MAG: PEGA domain-containing protein [Bacteroidota bacterium]|nr:PEGA domain-containing protein [Bacteroidota bacterium]